MIVPALAVLALGASDARAGCDPVRIGVRLAERDAPATRIAGTLCRPARRARTVQVLIHGSAYDRRYWDWPGHGGRYSYVRAMRRAGHATLAIDRLGSGRSSHPPAGFVTYENNVRAVAATVTWVRRNLRGTRIVLVGHSYGTLLAATVANRRRDIAAVVATGATTAPDTQSTAGLTPCLIDARTDPLTRRLVPRGDGGYLTSRPGCRADVFFDPAHVDPAVIAEDEARKGTLTPGEIVGSPLAGGGRWPVARVRAPVLLAIGDRDGLFCRAAGCGTAAALQAGERRRWRRARLTGVVHPGSGHSLNLHRSAPRFFLSVARWLRAHTPSAT